MPIYEYKCIECNYRFSKFLNISKRSDPTNIPCEKCAGKIVSLISSSCIVSGVSRKDTRPEWFKDRLKRLKKHAGKDNNLDGVI